uniref:CCHC-type domain-containing protein n=1 Tax=Tanacetum cinerariifolium TaxID=118510 RepID=A0A6L2J5B5_TANCI|nr:hypothetical protein [Tanacetum cinerariifolium]
MTLTLMAKAFTLNNITPTNNNLRISSNPSNIQIAQPGMNMDQDKQILMVEDNYGNGNVVPAPAEGNDNGINGNPIKCYNCRGEGHYASNCTVKPRKRDAAYLQQQLQITQEEEAGIQIIQEEFEFMAAADAYEETERTDQLSKVLLEKHDPPSVHDSEETLKLAQEKAAKFVQDFKSLAKEADESLAKHKALELEIERLLRVVVSQDIMSIVQNNSVVDTSNLQTELERTKERFENCIIKKKNEYANLWNDWYKKCEECKYDKISYDKAYIDIQQKIKRIQAQVLKYAKENAHLKTTYKNLFDSISVTQAQTKIIIESLKDKLHDTIYENAKLRAQLFDRTFEKCTPPKVFPKVDKTNALSKPVTSNSTPSFRESTVVNNERVIVPGIFRINPFKASRVDNFVPNKHVKASVRTKPITVSQPRVITKKDVNSITNGFYPKKHY